MATVNPFKPLLNKLPVILRNRYYLVLVCFGFWMIFIDRHDLITQIKLQNTMNKLARDKAYYEQKIEDAKAEKIEIESNKEKFVREHYFMSKSNEDVYIIEEKKK